MIKNLIKITFCLLSFYLVYLNLTVSTDVFFKNIYLLGFWFGLIFLQIKMNSKLWKVKKKK